VVGAQSLVGKGGIGILARGAKQQTAFLYGLTACTPGSPPGPTLGNEYARTLFLSVQANEGNRRSAGNFKWSCGCKWSGLLQIL